MDRRHFLMSCTASVPLLGAPAAWAAPKARTEKLSAVEQLLPKVGCGRYLKLLQRSGVLATLRGRSHTVFPLTDLGMDTMPQDYLQKMQRKGEERLLQFIVQLHAVNGLFTYEDLMVRPGRIVALSGTDLIVTRTTFGPMLNGVTVRDNDYRAPRVIVHPVDRLMIPS